MATTYDMKSIADTIRKAQYGKDVREAIAQGMEAYDKVSGDFFKRIDKLESKITQELEAQKKENDKINDSIDTLNKQKAASDDLQAVKGELQDRINHLYAGDPLTIKAVVEEILKEEGVI